MIENTDGCKINPKNLSATNARGHTPSGFLISTISPFRSIENKHDAYRGKDCTKTFCESLRGHTVKIINFENKK